MIQKQDSTWIIVNCSETPNTKQSGQIQQQMNLNA
jgi:hypothetical protein